MKYNKIKTISITPQLNKTSKEKNKRVPGVGTRIRGLLVHTFRSPIKELDWKLQYFCRRPGVDLCRPCYCGLSVSKFIWPLPSCCPVGAFPSIPSEEAGNTQLLTRCLHQIPPAELREPQRRGSRKNGGDREGGECLDAFKSLHQSKISNKYDLISFCDDSLIGL